MKKKIIFLVAAALMLNSCDDLFEPAIENFKDVEQMYDDGQYAQGFLVNVYRCLFRDTMIIVNMQQMMLSLIRRTMHFSRWLPVVGLPGYGRLSINGPIRSVLSSISIFSWKMWIR